MIESIALPKKHLVDLGLLGSIENSVIPHLADQRELILKNKNNPQIISQIAIQSSFYQQGIHQHLNPLVLALIGDKNIPMLGIKHAEKIFDFPKTEEDRDRIVVVIREILARLEKEVLLLRQVAIESLQKKPRIFNRIKYNVSPTNARILKDEFVEAYEASLDVVGGPLKIISMEWPVVVIPRYKNYFIAVGVFFYVPPIYFDTGRSMIHDIRPGATKKFDPKHFQAFSLLYHAEPLEEDVERFGKGEGRNFMGSLFGGAKKADISPKKVALKPRMKVDLENRRMKIIIPSSYIKDTTQKKWLHILPHLNYMVGVFVFLKIEVSDGDFKYLSLSMDMGMEKVKKEGIIPRFSPPGGVNVWLTPSAAKTSLNKDIIFRQTDSDNSLTDWIMPEEGTQEIFGLTSKKKSIGDWKGVEAHVSRMYLSTSSAGNPDAISVDIDVPREYENMISGNMNSLFEIGDPVLTTGWAALLKAQKLTELTFSAKGKYSRIRIVKDLNVQIILEPIEPL